jgi:hypothetical protein
VAQSEVVDGFCHRVSEKLVDGSSTHVECGAPVHQSIHLNVGKH